MNTQKKIKLLLLFAFVLTGILNGQYPYQDPEPGFQETVWVRSDRTLYSPGGKVSFAATLLEMDTYQTSRLSRIINIDILDSQGNIIIRDKFELSDGNLSAELTLPASLESGWYFLRGYTNWMRNFRESNICMLPLRVVNISDPEDVNIATRTDGGTKIQLIPEQGRLREGMPDNLIIHTTSTGGGSKAVKGTLSIPGTGEKYPFETGLTGWTIVSFEGGSLNEAIIELENIKPDNISMSISEYSDNAPFISFEEYFNNLSVSVDLGFSAGQPEYKLLVHSSGKILWYGTARPVGNLVKYYLPSENVPGTIAQFDLLDHANNIVASSLWANRNLFAQQPELVIANNSFQPGTECQATINIPSFGAAGSIEHLDVLIKKNEPCDLLENWLPGLPGWPADYSIPADPEARKAWIKATRYPSEVTSRFFIKDYPDPVNHGYNKNSLTLDIEKEVRFLPETRGVTVTGTVTHAGTGEPVQNIAVGATILNDNSFYADKTFPSGRFHLSLPSKEENLDMIIAFLEKPETDWELRIEPDFDNMPVKLRVPDFKITREELQYLSSININRQISKVYEGGQEVAPIKDSVTIPDRAKAFFGQPDNTVIVDDYIKLPNIREVVFEVVRNVFIRKKGDQFYMVVIGDLPIPETYKTVFLLDGVPLTDFNTFLDLPPDRLEKIEVKSRLFIHGNMAFGGAVNFVSANGDLAGMDLPRKSQLFTLRGASKTGNFLYSTPDNVSPNIPILSNTLGWYKEFSSYKNGFSFKTNDNLGDYSLQVYGFNKNGQWVYGLKVLNVALKANSE